ncbi:MAG TPA: flagellar protein FliT [Buttiauxella sp.]|jgi:flagellar protein FliT
MPKSIARELQAASRLNSSLMTLTGQGKWDEFIEAMTEYVALISEIMACDSEDLSPEESAALKQVVESLLENEAVMMQHMRSRLDVLRHEMTHINKGKAISTAYLEPFTSFPR